MNLFKIEKIDLMRERTEVIVRNKIEVVGKLDIICSAHGNCLRTIKLRTEATSSYDLEAARQAVENLLNHRYYHQVEYHFPKCSCLPILDKITYDFSDLNEPWGSMFEELFKNQNWSIARLINDAGSNAV